ncbi:MAG: ABC transporter ATP-binding protein [Olsenella profusa]
MITVQGVRKSYGGQRALDGVTFSALPGRVTALLGPNGAGKTTTLRILLGLEDADAGSALFDGVRYRDLATPLRTVGTLLDGSGAAGFRTPRTHLAWLAASNGIARSRIDEAIDAVGLSTVATRRISGFSLGMGQRLGMAAALLGDPATVILDEPTNGLDAEGVVWVRHMVRRLAEDGRTVLMTSHLLHEVQKMADDLVIIAGGHIVGKGALSDLLEEDTDLEEAYFSWTQGREQYAAHEGGER